MVFMRQQADDFAALGVFLALPTASSIIAKTTLRLPCSVAHYNPIVDPPKGLSGVQPFGILS
jgi:hypothetical protein